jgi:hypothetical protein
MPPPATTNPASRARRTRQAFRCIMDDVPSVRCAITDHASLL